MTQDSYEKYNAHPGIRFSQLRSMALSPAHYQHARTVQRTDTAALSTGRAVHCAVLEPDVFATRYAVYPGPVRRGKAWDEFAAAHTAAEIITADARDEALAIAAAVRAHPIAGPLLAYGTAEASAYWTDERTGLSCKCRTDWLINGCELVELKTTRDVTPRAFARSVVQYGYHAQQAFQQRGWLQTQGFPVRTIAVQKADPIQVVVYRVPDDAIAAGERLCNEWLARVADCTAAKRWPGIGDEGEVDLLLPAWALEQGGDDGPLNLTINGETEVIS